MTENVNLRAVVLDILTEVNEKGAYSHVTVNNALTKYQYLDKNERSFLTRLSEGTIEKQIYLDHVLDGYSKVKTEKMKPLIRNLLRMSAYQILFMDGVPDSAVCNEAVKLAKKRGFASLGGFVNGVLRSIAREKDRLKEPKDLSVKYSMPRWLVEEFTGQYGSETAEKILAAFEEPAPTYVRCNTCRVSVEEIVKMLEDQKVTVEEISEIPGALKLSDYDYLAGLKAFREGLVFVQDLSSMLAGGAAALKEGENVLDVCGAPGGKSIHAAVLMNGTGSVTTRDISESKVFKIKENVERMKLANITAEVQNALEFVPQDEEKYDAVFCDLPCSGLGIIGRKADIKYNMTKEKQEELAVLQRDILKTAYRYVRKGGRLIYSTCTINRKENEENARWIREELALKPIDLEERLPEKYRTETAKDGYVQLLPGIHGTDGFFIAAFQREE
ncbi:MAG: 16S rRNA (cytosine(967)-C(5))-methyltransferase RsmB [Alistipes sp.]|nr:16S rRNA (cytosine(967)-C(5))-methyltransferase RsmB [Alistipes sp.]